MKLPFVILSRSRWAAISNAAAAWHRYAEQLIADNIRLKDEGRPPPSPEPITP